MEYNSLADQKKLQKTVASLKNKGYEVYVVPTGSRALDKIKEIIPAGSSVMNGASVTLEQIGYADYLKSKNHKWTDLHALVRAENDPVKRSLLRRQTELSDFYLGSVHALTESGEFIVASNTGSQLPHIAYTSPNLIFVISTKKIVSSLDEGMNRLRDYVVPLEDKHMHDLYNVGTGLNKILIFRGEAKSTHRNIHVFLVEENLGF